MANCGGEHAPCVLGEGKGGSVLHRLDENDLITQRGFDMYHSPEGCGNCTPETAATLGACAAHGEVATQLPVDKRVSLIKGITGTTPERQS